MMPVPNIQNNKYTPSPLPEVCAPRRSLLAQMNAELARKLLLISAPAGSGKTVSALLWLRESGRKTAWIGLDALDGSASVFYRMFCTGILSAQPDNQRMSAILRDSAFASSPVEHTVNLLAEFLLDGNEYALVLDDFHTIQSGEILKSLPLILRRMPHAFVTLILSRTELADAFSTLAESGQASVIAPDALAFGGNEIQEYFAALGHAGAGEEAQAALAFTGGWAMGVSALAHSAAPAPEGFGGHDLERYIKKHIWWEWEESLRDFMLASAALDEMPVALCEQITGRADAGALLETLRAQNAFVTRVEDGVYRYHHLFLDFLRAQPAYADADKRERWRAAAEFYLTEKQYLTARRYAFKGGDTEIILNTLYAFTENRGFSIDEYLDYYRDFSRSQPMDVLCEQCPVLYISCAWVAFLTGDAPAFEHYEDKVLENLPQILQKYPRFGESTFSIAALDYRAPFREQMAKADLLPPIRFEGDALRAASISVQMPFMHRSCRDFHELTDENSVDKLKNSFGKLLKNHYEMIMHGLSAGLLLEQNRLGEALTKAQTAVSMLGEWTAKEMRFAALMHLAAVYLALEKKMELSDLLKETKGLVTGQAMFLRPNFLAFTTRIRLWDGEPEAAQEWLDQYFVTDANEMELYRIYQTFTTVRAYAALGELEKAKDLAARLKKLGEAFCRPLDAAEAGTLLAAFLWAAGQKKEAQDRMEAVLLGMQPHGFIRVIADEGAAVVPVLKKIVNKIERSDYQGELDRLYVNSVYLCAYAVSKQRPGILAGLASKPVKLSRQQKRILELIALGHKRDGIVEITGLTVNTIKTHTRLCYEKLGVGGAADAVVRARELGLID